MAIRTYGLSGSGMDVDQMVKDMLKARRASYDKTWQKKTQLEWKKADYNTMYTTLRDFRNNTVFNNKLQGTVMPKKVSAVNDSVVSVSANSDAANVSHVISVSQLASGVTQSSSAAISTGSKETVANQFGVTGSIALKINGKDITVDSSKSIYELVSSINNAGANVKANYDATLDRFFLYSTNSGSSAGIDFTGTSSPAGEDFLINSLKLNVVTGVGSGGLTSGTAVKPTDETTKLADQFSGLSGSFNLKVTNGGAISNITINTATDTLKSLMDKLNGAGVNASASYDVDGKFVLKATSGTLDLSGSDSAAMEFLVKRLDLSMKSQGQDAKITLDNVDLTQASNSFTISGVSYNLKSTGTTSVSIAADNDKAIANVKAFVESYNATLEKINGELKEKKYADFLPLTKEQKSALKDTEIADWEKQAKSGLLRRDPILQDIVYKMRSDISAPVSGITSKYTSLSSIGVTTGTYTEGGKLYLDETKLKAALEDDPDAVSKLLTTSGDTPDKQGVATRLHNTLQVSMSRITSEAGFSDTIKDDTESALAKRINNYNKELSNLDYRLQDIEKRYYKQFNAMETALNKMNQQSSWLSQQLGQ